MNLIFGFVLILYYFIWSDGNQLVGFLDFLGCKVFGLENLSMDTFDGGMDDTSEYATEYATAPPRAT